VIDRGVDAKTVAGAENYLVTRRCYLALRKATMARRDYDGIVVIDEKDRALTVNDVSMVMTTKIAATVPYDPSISRAVDAGVLPERGEKFGEHVRGILARSAVPA